MARWEEVIDHQVSLYDFWRSPLGKRFASGWVRSFANSAGLSGPEMAAEVRLHGEVHVRAADFLFGADPIWVDPDMQTLVENAAKTFGVEPLLPEDLLTDNGFLYLPRPRVSTDVHGRTISFRAVSWKRVHFTYRVVGEGAEVQENKDGIWLYFYHQRGDPDGWDTDGEMVRMERESGMPPLSLIHSSPWAFGETYFDPEDDSTQRYSKEAIDAVVSDARFMGAMFRMLTQTIAVRTQSTPSRAFRKRAAHLPVASVTVVTLRRHRESNYPADEHDAVEWSHRWLVSGHWRNQWFPSLGTHRQVWISPYIKGPDDAPLVLRTHRVFKFAR